MNSRYIGNNIEGVSQDEVKFVVYSIIALKDKILVVCAIDAAVPNNPKSLDR